MRRALRYLAASATAFAAVLALGTPASAGTVTPGGSFTATMSPWVLTDLGSGAAISCTSLAYSGTLMSSAGSSIGWITTSTATGCTGPVGLSFSVSAQGLPWSVNETSYNATTGIALGTFAGVRIKLSGLCNATLAGPGGITSPGTVNWSHNNSTAQLLAVTGGTLRVYGVSGTCLGLLNNGDTVTVNSNAFTLSPPQTIS